MCDFRLIYKSIGPRQDGHFHMRQFAKLQISLCFKYVLNKDSLDETSIDLDEIQPQLFLVYKVELVVVEVQVPGSLLVLGRRTHHRVSQLLRRRVVLLIPIQQHCDRLAVFGIRGYLAQAELRLHVEAVQGVLLSHTED